MQRILAFVPYRSIGRMLRLTLADEGYDVVTIRNCAAVEEGGFDAIIVDVDGAPLNGDAAVHQTLSCLCEQPVVVITADEPPRVLRQTGADAVLRKPFDGPTLAQVLRQLI